MVNKIKDFTISRLSIKKNACSFSGMKCSKKNKQKKTVYWMMLDWIKSGVLYNFHTRKIQNKPSLIKAVLHPFYSARLQGAIRIMEQRTHLFCCWGASILEDKYLSVVSSCLLRGRKQMPAIYLIPLEIMSQ